MKKYNVSKWLIPGFLFIGIGCGLIFSGKIPAAMPAFTLIGLGLGFLATFLVSRKK